MVQEDNELLVQDLSARLSYGVKGKCEIDASYDISFDTIFQLHKFDAILEGIKEDLLFVVPLIEDKDEQEFANEEVADGIDILEFKPYLRPMSSMTEKERKEYHKTFRAEPYGSGIGCIYVESAKSFDWLDKKMFDYRGLIPNGLALEALEGMYNI